MFIMFIAKASYLIHISLPGKIFIKPKCKVFLKYVSLSAYESCSQTIIDVQVLFLTTALPSPELYTELKKNVMKEKNRCHIFFFLIICA